MNILSREVSTSFYWSTGSSLLIRSSWSCWRSACAWLGFMVSYVCVAWVYGELCGRGLGLWQFVCVARVYSELSGRGLGLW